MLQPLQEFLRTSSAGGSLLLGAVIVALLWANSPWRTGYDTLWHTDVSIRLGGWLLAGDLRHAVNDGLMTLFFLLVGLEIKRELTVGELREWRAAALPMIAALGGMVIPALIYAAVNAGGPGANGWGIPMATDVAFALAVLTLAARFAPPSLKPFLLTLAIVDDIGAIVVIAAFYSGGIRWEPLGVAAGLLLVIVLMQRVHVRSTSAYLVLGFFVWYATYRSGVHPTIAGVVLGLLTPSLAFQRPEAVSDEARRTADLTEDEPGTPDADAHWWLRLAGISREAVSPLARVEHTLLPWSSFVILPMFALANAGVELSWSALGAATTSRIALGVVAGLVIGKLAGIWLATFAAVKLGVARLPDGVERVTIAGLAATAGVGFTVSLFIADLAFDDASLLDEAKLGILAASLLAGGLGYVVLRFASRGHGFAAE
ncbi:MAG: Na+/H+ antiporter NhaA [Actinomycetota bacterium]